jgi:hypothetical protein
MGESVTFIRKNGRIIPIKGASRTSSGPTLSSKARALGSKLAAEYINPAVSYAKQHPVQTGLAVAGLVGGIAARKHIGKGVSSAFDIRDRALQKVAPWQRELDRGQKWLPTSPEGKSSKVKQALNLVGHLQGIPQGTTRRSKYAMLRAVRAAKSSPNTALQTVGKTLQTGYVRGTTKKREILRKVLSNRHVQTGLLGLAAANSLGLNPQQAIRDTIRKPKEVEEQPTTFRARLKQHPGKTALAALAVGSSIAGGVLSARRRFKK